MAIILGDKKPAAQAKLAIPRPPGMDEFIMPMVPANIQSNGRYRVNEVTADVYNIAQRLKDLNPRLRINAITDARNGETAFTIIEDDGDELHVVFRCRRLDARVVEYVRYLLNVPFAKRFAEAEKLQAKWEEEAHEDELDELTERFGLEMQHDLKKNGFVDGTYWAGPTSRRSFGRG